MKQFLFSPTKQFQYASGKLLAGGKIYVYFKDTEDLAPLYNVDDSYQSNPIILDANGRASVKADDVYEYRLEVFSIDDVLQFTCNAFYAGEGDGSGGEFIVRHDETLSGNGTSQSLLGVVSIPLAVDDTMTAYEATVEETKALVLGVESNWFNRTFNGALSSKVDWDTFSACCSAVKGGLNNKLDSSAYDLSNYYTKNETTYLLSNYVTTPTFNDSIGILQNSKQDNLTFGYDNSVISSINNSAIGGQGASYPASAEDAVQYVVNNSATINEVNNTYESNSGNYITAHQPISSNQWNSNYNIVNSNSAKWNNISVYQNNSANYITAHQSLTGYLTTGAANTISSMLSGAIDYVSANIGQVISGDYELSAGYGVTLTDFPADNITRIDVTATTTFPITGTNGTASFTADMNSSAIYLSTAQGVAGLTTKFTGKGVQYQAYPSTDISASWYNIIKGANISSLKLTTAQASYSFTTDEIKYLSQINVATPYTYTGPSTYSVTLGTKTFSNLDSGCYYDFMRAEVEGTESWVIGPTGAYSLL